MGLGSKPLSVHHCWLTTFNFASYPFLSVPSTELFGLAAVGVFVSVSIGKSPPCGFIVRPCRFVSSTEPALPDTRLATGHLHLCRGDFPQCRTLSATLLLPHSDGKAHQHEPNGHHLTVFVMQSFGKHHSHSTTPRHRGQG